MLKYDLLESQSWSRCPPTCVGQGVAPNSNLPGATLILYLNLLIHTFEMVRRAKLLNQFAHLQLLQRCAASCRRGRASVGIIADALRKSEAPTLPYRCCSERCSASCQHEARFRLSTLQLLTCSRSLSPQPSHRPRPTRQQATHSPRRQPARTSQQRIPHISLRSLF